MRYEMSKKGSEANKSERHDQNSQNKVPLKNSIFCVEGLCDSMTIYENNLNLGIAEEAEICQPIKKEMDDETDSSANVVIKEELFESVNVCIIENDDSIYGRENASQEVQPQLPTQNCNLEKEIGYNLIDVKEEISEELGGCSSSLLLDQMEDHMLSPKEKSNFINSEKPYRCSYCPYQASHKGNFQNHLKIHTGEKPFECSYCPYQASLKGNLQNHLRTHTGEKPFKCNLCPYQASQKGTLQNHLRTHTGEKPYKCTHCPYTASRKGNYQNHLKIHSGEKPFKCNHCPYQASHKVYLQRHLRRHKSPSPQMILPIPL